VRDPLAPLLEDVCSGSAFAAVVLFQIRYRGHPDLIALVFTVMAVFTFLSIFKVLLKNQRKPDASYEHQDNLLYIVLNTMNFSIYILTLVGYCKDIPFPVFTIPLRVSGRVNWSAIFIYFTEMYWNNFVREIF